MPRRGHAKVRGARLLLLLAPILIAGRGATARAAESHAVVAAGEPAPGIDPDLAELAHQLRAACRDRVGNVLDVPTMIARLRGQTDGATLQELDRAYGGALAVYQNGEFESAQRTLRAIVADLEALPESREAFQQWIRANLRLAHAFAAIGAWVDSDAALARILRVEPSLRADPDQYSPGFRRRIDDVRARVRALPHRRVTVVAAGRPGHLFIDGRPSGTTPMTLFLPAGRYRVGGAAGALRVPSFPVDVSDEDRTVVLDFETAEAIRMNAGPGLVLTPARRAEGLIRAGAWLDVDRLVVASRGVEGDAHFLVGAIYDVRRGALLREGSVRTVAGSVPSVNIGALAAFLLTGAQQREVRARTPDVVAGRAEAPVVAVAAPGPAPALPPDVAPPDLRPAPPAPEGAAAVPLPWPRAQGIDGAPPASWRRPAAWGSGIAAALLAGVAVQRRLAANDAFDDAEALTGPGGTVRSAADVPRVRSLEADGVAAARQSWISAGASLAFAVAAGYLGWSSTPPGGVDIRF